MTDRILVIDDSSTIQKVIQIALEPYKVKVASASSYLEAISETNHNLPDLVIADASLPGIKGAEDYAQLQKRLQNVPFLILQGSYEVVNEDAFRSNGFHLFLKKPFEAQELINTIEEALGHKIGSQNQIQSVYKQVSNGPVLTSSPPPPPPPPMSSVSGLDEFSHSEQTKTRTETLPPPPPPVSLSLGELDDEEVSGYDDHDLNEHFTEDALFLDQKEQDDSPFDADLEANHDFSLGDSMAPDLDDKPQSSFGLEDEDPISDHAPPIQKSGKENHRRGRDLNFSAEKAESELDEFMPPPPPPLDLSMGDSDFADDLEPPTSPPQQKLKMVKNDSSFSPNESLGNPRSTSDSPPASLKELSSDARGLVEPFLREELATLVKQTVIEYCERQFGRIAREIVSEEIKKLTEEKARLIIDK